MKTNLTREPIDVILPWIIGTSFIALMVTVSLVAPLLYIWVIGLTGCLAVLSLTLTVGGSLMSNGSLFDAVIGYRVIEGGFEIIGAILAGLAKVSSSD